MTLFKPAVTRITDEQSVVVERREALLHTVLGSVANPKKGDARQQHGQLLKGCTRPTLRGVVPARVEIPADAGQQLITQSRRRFRSLGEIGGQASPPASKVARPGLCFWIKSFRQGLQEALSKSPLLMEGKKAGSPASDVLDRADLLGDIVQQLAAAGHQFAFGG